jgi:hypothetical protein
MTAEQTFGLSSSSTRINFNKGPLDLLHVTPSAILMGRQKSSGTRDLLLAQLLRPNIKITDRALENIKLTRKAKKKGGCPIRCLHGSIKIIQF